MKASWPEKKKIKQHWASSLFHNNFIPKRIRLTSEQDEHCIFDEQTDDDETNDDCQDEGNWNYYF
jgi:hypothetical protein